MNEPYILDYIKEKYEIDNEAFEALKLDLDKRIYYYGSHFKFPIEGGWQLKDCLFQAVKDIVREYYILSRIALNNTILRLNKVNILSNSYFDVNNELKKIGFGVYSPSWCMNGDKNILTDYDLYYKTVQLQKLIKTGVFKDLFSRDMLAKVAGFKQSLTRFVAKNNFAAICVFTDMCLFESLAIQAFRQAKKPSFIFLHGLPARYSAVEDNRADYLIVWGDRIKDNFVKAGVRKEKIFVSGHPGYRDFQTRELKNSFDDVLVISKSMNGSQYNDRVVLSDRGNLITYLYSAQSALEKNGVSSARVRFHPSENSAWYRKFIDTDFYKIDNQPLLQSLGQATMIVGPTSSVFLEATYCGVNYVVYEPCNNGVDLLGFRPAPPFDGSDPRIPVAKAENDLVNLLKNKAKNSCGFFNEYIKNNFDISFIKKIIG